MLDPQVHPHRGVEPVTAAGARRRGRLRALLREGRSLPTVAVVLFSVLAGVPAVVALTPAEDVVALGQPLSVGARAPSLSVSGPAQLVQIGNTELDLNLLQVYGPLRPRLEMGPVQRNDAAARVFDPAATTQVQTDAVAALTGGFVRWYLWAGMGLLGFTLAAAGGAGCLRMLAIVRRRSRAGAPHTGFAELWHHVSGTVSRMTVIALAASTLTWLVSGALAYAGTVDGLAKVGSVSDLVGSSAVTPTPVGPQVFGFQGAVIGDSRASRVGGPPVPEPSPADVACGRSTDSLAAETGSLLDAAVLNLSCPSASVTEGLRGPQPRGELTLPPQVGLLRQVQDLDFVVVAIGPNDIGWTDFIQYCYAVASCADNFTEGEFDYRIARFDRDYGDLLADLAALPTQPEVVVVGSYDVLAPDAACPDSRGPESLPGLSPPEMELMSARNAQLNDVLAAGAAQYGFAMADPQLSLLCDPAAGGAPDLQGLADPHPFHPTAAGSLRMAAAVARWIPPGTIDRAP